MHWLDVYASWHASELAFEEPEALAQEDEYGSLAAAATHPLVIAATSQSAVAAVQAALAVAKSSFVHAFATTMAALASGASLF